MVAISELNMVAVNMVAISELNMVAVNMVAVNMVAVNMVAISELIWFLLSERTKIKLDYPNWR